MIKTIENNTISEFEIKKSKFIGYTFKIQNTLDVEKNLNMLIKEHSDATHICYGYVLNGQEKCSDNGEPSGTAGLPILEVIKKNGLTNVLVVSVRYFGGIKLGAGGLIRAYSKSASLVIKDSGIKELEQYNLYDVELEYNNVQIFNKITKENDIKVLSTTYSSNVICSVATKDSIDAISSVALSISKTGQEWF